MDTTTSKSLNQEPTSAHPPVKQPPMLPVEPTPLGLTPPHMSRSQVMLRVIPLMIGALIVLIIGVLLFQPRAYFWVMTKAAGPERVTTDTLVKVERTFIPNGSDATAQSTQKEHDTIDINYKASFISPDTWAFISTLTSSNPAFGGSSFEARLFGKDIYQRNGLTGDFASSTFPEDQYQSTVKVIRAESVFLNQFFDYALNPRFVFAKGNEPFWMLHYRFEVDVAKLEKEKPDWFIKEAFPFSSDESIQNQTVRTYIDIWVNPFTSQVQKEQWRIVKNGVDPSAGAVQLYILLNRDFSYPDSLTIDKPQTTS